MLKKRICFLEEEIPLCLHVLSLFLMLNGCPVYPCQPCAIITPELAHRFKIFVIKIERQTNGHLFGIFIEGQSREAQ